MEQGNGPRSSEGQPRPELPAGHWVSGPGLAKYKAMDESQQLAEIEALIRFQEENPDYWGDQDENGVDLARLRENLKLTPAERIDKHEAARWLAFNLKETGENSRASERSSSRFS